MQKFTGDREICDPQNGQKPPKIGQIGQIGQKWAKYFATMNPWLRWVEADLG
jgi:hypothetical protein